MANDKFGNIVVSGKCRADLSDYLMACECPDCKAIFTIELTDDSSSWKNYVNYSANCPVCGKGHNWMAFRIGLTEYKFRRAWRGFRRKATTRDKHSV